MSHVIRGEEPRLSQGDRKKNSSRTALDEMGEDGTFRRTDAGWRNFISRKPGAKFPPAPGRYHLFCAYACGWANRVTIVRKLKGLEDAIGVTMVMPVWQPTKPEVDGHCGWHFSDPSNKGGLTNALGLGGPFPASYPKNDPEPFFGCKTVRELYERAGDTDGKYTVPILWDKQLNTIVSNESSEIIQMLNSEFNEFAMNPDLDLEPEDLVGSMKEVDSFIYHDLNNGVYKCGFAQTQEAYDVAIEKLTSAFDRVESILSKQRYIAGDRLTLSDVRLFVTLMRFDEVYAVYFKTNTRSVANSEVLLNYVREIYQMPGVQDTIDMDQIKLHYFASHPHLNKFSIVPKGPNFIGMLQQPHNRESSGDNNKKLKLTTTPSVSPTDLTLDKNAWDPVLVG
ncbi:glutathione S-transferase, C-terminal-like protein [Nitzschia inconspicua]|uniref:Glutathione S-transferase, C-terminal-like protein n=1 Tax=Nitzschia inconspicua TaxID=303405 RepID=A0A9K3M7P5_9STRA|nr:glutathione S-transferase, C-terminal-like protein [Nitzschia inconspicua]